MIESSLTSRTPAVNSSRMNVSRGFASPALPFAVPSWLVPGTAAENARLLKTLDWPEDFCLAEMGLCCFESEASLSCPQADYPAPDDLPPGMVCHVHLPTDLPWHTHTAPETALRLIDRLPSVRRVVLHPPGLPDTERHLCRFVDHWMARGRDPADVLLENDKHTCVADFLRVLETMPVRVCLDVAHALAYGHEHLCERLDPGRVLLVHWSAPGPIPGKDAHLPLTHLTGAQWPVAHAAARRFAQALPLVEVFSLDGVRQSLPVLRQLSERSQTGQPTLSNQ